VMNSYLFNLSLSSSNRTNMTALCYKLK